MDGELLEQGLQLMLAGMGTVFVFLTLLVLATTLMSRLVQRFMPAAEASDDASAEEVAAIAAALAVHRNNRRA